MRNAIAYFLVDTLILATMIYAEVHPNKYLENTLKFAGGYSLIIVLLAVIVFFFLAMQLPSQSGVEVAKALLDQPTRARRALNYASKVQETAVILTAFVCGRWLIGIAFTLHGIGNACCKVAAKNYVDKLAQVRPTKPLRGSIIDIDIK